MPDLQSLRPPSPARERHRGRGRPAIVARAADEQYAVSLAAAGAAPPGIREFIDLPIASRPSCGARSPRCRRLVTALYQARQAQHVRHRQHGAATPRAHHRALQADEAWPQARLGLRAARPYARRSPPVSRLAPHRRRPRLTSERRIPPCDPRYAPCPELVRAGLGYAENVLDRSAEHRDDKARMAALAASPPPARWSIAGDIPLLRQTGAGLDPLSRWTSRPASARVRETTSSALDGEAPGASASHSMPRAPDDQERRRHRLDRPAHARRAGLLPAPTLGGLAQAKSLLDWHQRHRFCANCGQPTSVSPAGWRRECAVLRRPAFPAHRSGRDHAGRARRQLPARPPAHASPPACIRALPGSSSRARRSRTRCAARLYEESGVAIARCATSPRSPGRSPPR